MADTAPDTLAARLARVSRDCRDCPVIEIPARVGGALLAHGLMVTSVDQQLVTLESPRRALLRLTVVVAEIAPSHATSHATTTAVAPHSTTFVGLADLLSGPFDLGAATLFALQSLWIAALAIDTLHPSTLHAVDATSWEAHLRACAHPAHIRNAWRKHRDSFVPAGVSESRRGAALDAIARIRGARAETFTLDALRAYLDAPPESDGQSSQPRQRVRAGAPT